jgi:hypothetical protein
VRLEQFPLVLGVLVGLLGLVLLGDALVADRGSPPLADRRRRARAERDRVGEAMAGLGLLCLAAALAGRDTWRFGNVAVIAGTVLLVVGAALNHRFLRELFLFRGPARRQDEREPRGREVTRHMSAAAAARRVAADEPPASGAELSSEATAEPASSPDPRAP